MEKIIINGGRPLYGSIQISGSKNSVLPIMAAALLFDRQIMLNNVPLISDARDMLALLRATGVEIGTQNIMGHNAAAVSQQVTLKAAAIDRSEIPGELAKKMRASILLFGSLLARTGYAKMALPGGCAIGVRPVDFHIQIMRQMGANVQVRDDYLEARADQGLHGAMVDLPNVSVGATENALLLASLASGQTVIHNASVEPEVLELIGFLRKMGVAIDINGNACISVSGRDHVGNDAVEFAISGDRIEAGTYAMAVAATGGELELFGIAGDTHTTAWVTALENMGVHVSLSGANLIVARDRSVPLKPVSVVTRPHPHFPSDLQAQLAALATEAEGISIIQETLYENRMLHIAALQELGANVNIVGNKVIICGRSQLRGAHVEATDLRELVPWLSQRWRLRVSR